MAGEEGEDRRWRQQQRGTCIGEALLEALAAPGLRTAKQPPARGSGRERGPAADAAREEEQGRGGKRRQGIIVDIPDVSKGGRCALSGSVSHINRVVKLLVTSPMDALHATLDFSGRLI